MITTSEKKNPNEDKRPDDKSIIKKKMSSLPVESLRLSGAMIKNSWDKLGLKYVSTKLLPVNIYYQLNWKSDTWLLLSTKLMYEALFEDLMWLHFFVTQLDYIDFFFTFCHPSSTTKYQKPL